MADEFRYRPYVPLVPANGVMSALPKAEPGESWSPEPAYTISGMSFGSNPYLNQGVSQGIPSARIENLPKDFYLNRTPGENFADIMRRAFEGGAYKNSPQLDNLAFGGQMLFENNPVVAAGNTQVALERGDYGQAALEATGFVPFGKLAGTTLAAVVPAVAAGAKRLFAGAMRSEPEIANLVKRGLTENSTPEEVKAAAEAARAAKKERKALTETKIVLPLKTRENGLYSKAEEALLQFKQPETTAQEFINFLKGKGVKDSEIKALGIQDIVDNYGADHSIPTNQLLKQVSEKMPRLNRISGMHTTYDDYVEVPGVGEYREIVYTMPFTHVGKVDPAEIPSYDQLYAYYRKQLAKEIEEKKASGYTGYIPDIDSEDTIQRLQKAARKELKQLQNNARDRTFTHTQHWTETNPALHIRATDVARDGKRVFKVEELQSDWAQKKAQFAAEGMGGIPDAPWMNDDSWMDLGAKKAIVEAVTSGADELELVPGIVHSKRWNKKGLESVYDEKIKGAFDRATKEAGVPAGKLVKSELEYTTQQIQNYIDYMEPEEIQSWFNLNVQDPDNLQRWNIGSQHAINAAEDPDYIKVTKDNISQQLEIIDDEMKALEKRADNLYEELASKYGEAYSSTLRKKVADGSATPEEAIDYSKMRSIMREDQSLSLARSEQKENLTAIERIAEPLLKRFAGTQVLNTERYVLKITPELRKFVQERGFSGFAKGGIVDLANYMAWSQ